MDSTGVYCAICSDSDGVIWHSELVVADCDTARVYSPATKVVASLWCSAEGNGRFVGFGATARDGVGVI